MSGKTSKLAFMGKNVRNGTEHKCLLDVAEVLKFQKEKDQTLNTSLEQKKRN